MATSTSYQLPPRSAAQAALVDKARDLIPGGTVNAITPVKGTEFVVARGEGPYLYDVDGRRYLDFLLGGGPLILGHAHPRMVEALTESVRKGTHHMELTDRTIALAERLVKYVPSAEAVRFSSTGSEATFHALRLARAVTGRSAIIKFDGAYHGHHDLATWSYEDAPLDAPIQYAGSTGIQPGVAEDIIVLPYNDATAVEEYLTANPGKVAALIVEPYQRALTPVPGFLAALRESCDRHGVVLIFDEVVTGIRTAPGGAQEAEGVTPDLTALGKAIAGGLPLSAIVGRKELMEHFDHHSDPTHFAFHCGTFNGNLHAVEAAHTTLDIVIEEKGYQRLAELGEYTRAMLARVYADAGITVQVTGRGPLFHAYFTDKPVLNAHDVRSSNLVFNRDLHLKLREAGIYKSFPKGYLSLAHDESHVDAYGEAISWAVGQLA